MNKATFTQLAPTDHYDILDRETGTWLLQGISGREVMKQYFPEDTEAWPAGEVQFLNPPVEIATKKQ